MIRSRQRGIALLVAIVMFALATTVAAAITYNKAMAARRAAATFTMEQGLQAGMAAEALAAIALEDAATKPQTEVTQDWAQPLGPLEIEGTGVWIQAQVEDLQGRFNLNSLVRWNQTTNAFEPDPHQEDIFKELLQALELEPRWASLMEDWIDPGIEPNIMDGGEDTLYLSQNPPYRPPNTFINHPSELLALPGFGAERYAKLAPFVTALPVTAKVNVCTASGLVLDVTLNDRLNQSQYRNTDLAAERTRDGCWPEANLFTNVIGDPQLKSAVQSHIEEISRWFRLRTNIRVGTAEFVLYSVLYREDNNKIRTVQRSFGSE